MALRFGTGRVPGCPRQIGQTLVFGSAPNSFRQAQNILVAVESSTWHSRPMTVSRSAVVRGSAMISAQSGQLGPHALLELEGGGRGDPQLHGDLLDGHLGIRR